MTFTFKCQKTERSFVKGFMFSVRKKLPFLVVTDCIMLLIFQNKLLQQTN